MNIGRYAVRGRIGRGGMAQVLLAETQGIDGFSKRVVLKVLLPHLAADPEFLTMFADEARLVSGLVHPAIVQVHDFGEVDGRYFIAMEHVDGVSLAQLITEPMPIEAVRAVMLPVLDALALAHAKGVVHRDVTPHNILISRDGVVKVTDFGIAKGVMTRTKTRTGLLKGQFAYMAPEQAQGKTLDGRADVFSAGLVAHQMLTAKLVYDADDEMERLAQARLAAIPPIDNAAVMRALVKDPDGRFARAADFAAALAGDAWDRARLAEWVARMHPEQALEEVFDDELGERPPTTPPRSKKLWITALAIPAALTMAFLLRPHPAPLPVAVAVAASQPMALQAPEPAVTPLGTPHGYLTLNSRPWSHVFVDGQEVAASTPLQHYKVTAGRHTIEMRRKDGVKSRFEVEVADQEVVTRVIVDWSTSARSTADR